MKKVIITTAIILSASATFYAKQKSTFNIADVVNTEKLTRINKLNFGYGKDHKMDIGQADMSN